MLNYQGWTVDYSPYKVVLSYLRSEDISLEEKDKNFFLTVWIQNKKQFRQCSSILLFSVLSATGGESVTKMPK